MNDIIIDFEKLKDFESGLGQFCYHLYKNLPIGSDYLFATHKSCAHYFKEDDHLHYLNFINKCSFLFGILPILFIIYPPIVS